MLAAAIAAVVMLAGASEAWAQVGGCCTNYNGSGVCTPGQSSAACVASGGIYKGDGTDCTDGCPVVTINEVRTDMTGTDTSEYFELAGPGGLGLTGLTYIVIGDGTTGSGVIEKVISLAGKSLPGDGHFLAATGNFALGGGPADYVFQVGNDAFENGDNVTHILVAGFTGALNQDLDTLPTAAGDGVLDTIPWSAVVDRVAIILQPNPPTTTEFHYGVGAEIVGPDGTFAPGHVYRCPDATGAWKIGVFNPADPGSNDSPGSTNGCVGACCSGDTCNLRNQVICQATGGTYIGDNVPCTSPNPCLPTDSRACCFNDGTCQNLTVADCATAAGTSQGVGTACSPSPTGLRCCSNANDMRGLSVPQAVPATCELVISSLEDTDNTATELAIQAQDLTGDGTLPANLNRGITILGDPTVLTTLLGAATPGTRVTLKNVGLSDQALNRQITVDGTTTLTVNGTTTPPAPIVVTVAEASNNGSAELFESCLVRLNCVQFMTVPTTNFTGETNYTVTDGTTTLVVRVPTTTTPVIGTAIPTGTCDLIGVESQFTGTQQLMLRYAADVIPNAACPGTEACCFGNGTCANLYPNVCVARGGISSGGGQPCSLVNCVAATGACCVAGTCNSGQTAAQCATAGGTYLGDASTCIAPTCGNPTAVRINEIRIDQSGTDNDEFFELKGAPNTPLGSLTYIVLGDTGTDDSGAIETIIPLTGKVVDATGYFLGATQAFTLPATPDFVFSPTINVFENTDNVTHMLVTGFTGSINQDLDTNNDGILDATPWTAVVDSIGVAIELNPPGDPTHGYTYGAAVVGPDGANAPAQVYRCPDGVGPFQIGLFATTASDTPKAVNPTCTVACTCRGDVNGDTLVDGRDVNSFVACLTAGGSCTCADVNNDTASDPGDITAFVTALLAGACAP